MDTVATPTTLLTFPPMIDSELSRFVLNVYGVAYREEPHIFGWASLIALVRGATLQIPLLSGAGLSLAGPRAMVDHFEGTCTEHQRLIPEELSGQVEADWIRFNGTLASATAVLGYFHLLPHRALMLEPFSRGVPPPEATLLKSAYPAFAGLFKLLLQLNPEHARKALAETRTIFEETDRRIRDERSYLVGDRLTLSDLALATACAPVLLPECYGSPMPPFDQMPSELQAIISELREYETARFVERISRTHRQREVVLKSL